MDKSIEYLGMPIFDGVCAPLQSTKLSICMCSNIPCHSHQPLMVSAPHSTKLSMCSNISLLEQHPKLRIQGKGTWDRHRPPCTCCCRCQPACFERTHNAWICSFCQDMPLHKCLCLISPGLDLIVDPSRDVVLVLKKLLPRALQATKLSIGSNSSSHYTEQMRLGFVLEFCFVCTKCFV